MDKLTKLTALLVSYGLVQSVYHGEDFDSSEGCHSRDYRHGSVVCVCNIHHCDSLPPVTPPDKGHVTIVTTNKAGARWQVKEMMFQDIDNKAREHEAGPAVLEINRGTTYQKIVGFGGAFTDASGINIKSLPTKLQNNILRAYYSTDGLEYNLGRVPIGGTDFSTHPYTYDDLPPGQTDPSLSMFHLATEDLLYKIPIIQQALKLRGGDLKLFASPWSAPGWMKDNQSIHGKAKLISKYYSSWAKYFVKFLKAYLKRGIGFFGVTAQNEPTDGRIHAFSFNSMGWTALNQGIWIAKHLGPQLEASGFQNTSIFIVDDNRILVPRWVDKVMSIPNASKYVGGIAVHWYLDYVISPYLLDLTNEKYPSLPILYTEACVGQWPWEPLKVVLGSWVRAQDYAYDIIENLNHYVVGWTDWNIALDMKGGPNWVKNFVDSPIIVNPGRAEFYKQPTYYILGHFSKFLPRDSIRIDVKQINDTPLQYVALMRPDNSTVLIILNKHHQSGKIILKDNDKQLSIQVEPYSIQSMIWA